jgi:hypothetical protein
MPIEMHMQLWREAPRRLLAQSRYAALLVSMHGMRLYEMRDLSRLSAADAAAVTDFLATSRAFQRELAASLGVDDAQLRRNSDLIWTWDFLSLALCLDWAPCKAKAVPSAEGPVELTLAPDGTLEPWPFTKQAVSLRVEGRRLTERYDTDQKLAAALASARWETVCFELRSA